MTIEEKIRNFIVENFIFEPGQGNFDNTQSFLETGIIDSTGILELVSFIEEHYGIKIEDEELIPANLDSISNVARFINKKLAA
jgi:acyl carrier protein